MSAPNPNCSNCEGTGKMQGVLLKGSEHDCFCVTHDRGPKEVEEMSLEEAQMELRCWRRGELYRGYDRIKALEIPGLKTEIESQAARIRQLEGEKAALREELKLANAECDRLRLALNNAQSDILKQLDILKTANQVVLADWAHGPFKELDIYIGSACVVLRYTAKEIDEALTGKAKALPSPPRASEKESGK